MTNVLWLIHIFGLCLWVGPVTGGLIVWPSKRQLLNETSISMDLRTVVRMITRTGHIGAGLTALAGAVYSFYVQPKSDLGSLWLTTMQGVGVIAFVFFVIVMTRIAKRLRQLERTEPQFVADAHRYRVWLIVVFILLFICLVMAAFKPTL